MCHQVWICTRRVRLTNPSLSVLRCSPLASVWRRRTRTFQSHILCVASDLILINVTHTVNFADCLRNYLLIGHDLILLPAWILFKMCSLKLFCRSVLSDSLWGSNPCPVFDVCWEVLKLSQQTKWCHPSPQSSRWIEFRNLNDGFGDWSLSEVSI